MTKEVKFKFAQLTYMFLGGVISGLVSVIIWEWQLGQEYAQLSFDRKQSHHAINYLEKLAGVDETRWYVAERADTSRERLARWQP